MGCKSHQATCMEVSSEKWLLRGCSSALSLGKKTYAPPRGLLSSKCGGLGHSLLSFKVQLCFRFWKIKYMGLAISKIPPSSAFSLWPGGSGSPRYVLACPSLCSQGRHTPSFLKAVLPTVSPFFPYHRGPLMLCASSPPHRQISFVFRRMPACTQT